MIKLVRFLSGHFAPSHSPTREQREAHFAVATGGGTAFSPESQERGPRGKNNKKLIVNPVDARIRETKARVFLEAPETIEGVPQLLESSPEFLMITLENPLLEGAVLEIAHDHRLRLSNNIPAEGVSEWTTQERDDVLQMLMNDTGDAQVVMKELLRNPELLRALASASERRVARHDELLKRVQTKILNTPDILERAGISKTAAQQLPVDKVVSLFMQNTNETNANMINKELELDTTIENPKERQRILDYLLEGIDDARKEQSMGLRSKKLTENNTDEEGENTRYRERYWRTMRENTERMKSLLLVQLRHRADQLYPRMNAVEGKAKKMGEDIRRLSGADADKAAEMQMRLQTMENAIQTIWDRGAFLCDLNCNDRTSDKPTTQEQRDTADKKLLADDGFLSLGEQWVGQLDRYEDAIRDAERIAQSDGKLRSRQEDVEAEANAEWARDTIQRANRLLNTEQWDEETLVRLRQFADPEHLKQRAYESPTIQSRVNDWLDILQNGGPEVVEEVKKADQEQKARPAPKEKPEMREFVTNARAKLAELEPKVMALSKRFDLQSVNAEAKFRRVLDRMRDALKASQDGTCMLERLEEPELNVLWKTVDTDLRKMDECVIGLEGIPNRVRQIDNADEYSRLCGGVKDSIAHYNPSDRTIYINASRLPKDSAERSAKLQKIVEHEEGHAAKDILRAMFPNLVSNEFEWVFEMEEAAKDEFIEKLLTAGEEWGLSREKYQTAFEECFAASHDRAYSQNYALQLHFDELNEKFEEWQSGKSVPTTDEEKWLHIKIAHQKGEVAYAGGILHLTEHHDDHGNHDEHEEAHETQSENVGMRFDAVEPLAEIKKMLVHIWEFGESNPSEKEHVRSLLGGPGQGGLQGRYHELEHIWATGTTPDGVHLQVPPERDPDFKKYLNELTKVTTNIFKQTEKIKSEKTDQLKAKSYRTKGFFSNIHFLSISDVVKIYNDIKEDFVAQWNRAQERKTSEVALALTEMLPEEGFFGTPFEQYAGRLKHYSRRRQQQAESDAVHKWEEAMKIMDPHALLALLGRSPTKDQLKATILVLTHKGHMDWSSQDLWAGLHTHSRYRMPKEAKYDDLLRDIWIRKLCTDIWPDEKEFFDHAKTENEQQFEGGKKRYTGEADNLSNVKGGMGMKLRGMLKMFDEHHGHPPVEVSPHEYEEFIHFAMRDGKMAMEEKLYYLVRGAATGLLPVDRVRSLAGEKGGILNVFPFIEYFSGQNNTLSELQKLSERLKNVDDHGHDTYEPNYRTTLWLRLEVARNPRVLARIGKGTSKTNAENIDHEDWPWFLPMQGYSGVRNALNIISGARQKTSPQARQNTYYGFSSVFKVFGQMAKVEAEGLTRITSADTRTLAQTIAAYIDYDNILTQNFADGEKRPNLSEAEFDVIPPSGDKHTTRQTRKGVNTFVGAILRAYKNDIESDPEWLRVSAKGTDKADRLENIEEFAATDDRLDRNLTDDKKKRIAKCTETFVRLLEKVIQNNPDRLREALRANADGLADEGGSMDTGGLTKAKVHQYFAELRTAQSDEGVGDHGHGGGHGGHH